tara:strand:+ start:6092 stop:6286 length:195 start_codon:yes stop_codon:yes gene_type:complete
MNILSEKDLNLVKELAYNSDGNIMRIILQLVSDYEFNQALKESPVTWPKEVEDWYCIVRGIERE